MSPKNIVKLILLGIIGIFVLSSFTGSWYTVAETERAVLTTNGSFTAVVGPGLHFKVPFFQAVTPYQVTIQEISTDRAATGESTFTVDKQEAFIHIKVLYRIKPDSVEFVYKNTPDPSSKIYYVAVDRMKKILGTYNTNDISPKRAEIAKAIRDSIEDFSASTLGIEVVDLQIPDIDYNLEFKQSVIATANAKQAVDKAEEERKRIVKEAETAKARAEGEASAVKAKADGEAYARLANATAEAKAIELEGLAKAQAIKAQADALATNSTNDLTEYTKALNWDGKLPQWVGTGPMPFMQVNPAQQH